MFKAVNAAPPTPLARGVFLFSLIDKGRGKKPTLCEEMVLNEAETFISKGSSWDSSRGGCVRQLEYSEARLQLAWHL